VHNSYRQPGGEDIVFEQEKALLESYGCEVFTYQRSNHEVEDQYGGLRRPALLTHIVWANDTEREFSAVLRELAPDIVHVHNTFFMISPCILPACQKAGIPVVMTLHNFRLFCPAATSFRDGKICEECIDHGLWRGIWHGCYRESRAATAAVVAMLAYHRHAGTFERDVDRYILLTEFARNKFARAGLPGHKLSVKPNFVHPDPGMRNGSGEYALFVGRLSVEKGVLTVLKAWQRLGGRIPLRIVGGGNLCEVVQDEIRRGGLHEVEFLGQISRAETIEQMKGARFLVFPSEWYEQFPMTLIESFACGVPVLASELGAMTQVVTEGRTGRFFRSGNVDDLVKLVNWAWAEPAEIQRMGREARLEFESKYTGPENYEMLMDIYQKAIESKQKCRTRPIAA
jgi:glycosyltransferase involved in cell wall biosynthesis